MGKGPRLDKMGMKKGPWTPKEDEKLLAYIQEHGHDSWRALPSKAGLQRCGKSCRLRWTNYLRPDIKRGKFSLQEEQTIIQLHALLGNRWSAIANHLPRRTDNDIKNYWNTHLKKKLNKMGIDPMTHKPMNHALGCGQTKDFVNLCHAAQWESARLEAEARIVRESKFISNHNNHLHRRPAAAAAGAPPPPQSARPCLDILQVWVRTNPGKDILNGFFTANGTQTSTLNLSHNENHDEMSGTGLAGQANNLNYHQDMVKGITGNSTELHGMMNPIMDSTDHDHGASSLGFPNSFMEGFADLPPTIVSNIVEACWNVLQDEDQVNDHWANL